MRYSRKTRAERGYNYKWQKARKLFLQLHPLCKLCAECGITKGANVVDHVIPHKGDDVLFWDKDNWQPLCKHCHDSVKQSEERTGFLKGASADGMPLSPYHPWNRRSQAHV